MVLVYPFDKLIYWHLTGLLQICKSGCCLPAGLIIIIRLNTLDLLTKQIIVKQSPLWSKQYLGLSFLCQQCQLNFLAILEAAVKDVKHNSILAPTPSLKTGKNAYSCLNLVMVWSIMTMFTMVTMLRMLPWGGVEYCDHGDHADVNHVDHVDHADDGEEHY